MRMVIFLLLFTAIGASAAPEDSAVAEFFRDKTKIENPFELRDPFKAPLLKSGRKKVKEDEGSESRKTDDEAALETMNLSDIKVVGVLIGKERLAVLRTSEDKPGITYVKEGTKVGPDKAEVKAILPGGIILVEKIINVYGQEEYLETVIPISK